MSFYNKLCTNHPTRKALSFCRCCEEFYCEACLGEAADYYYCSKPVCQSAAAAAVEDAREESHAAYARLFCPQCIEATNEAPGSIRLLLMNGIGFRLGRGKNKCPVCHSVEARVWLCLFFIPVLPCTKYRLVFTEGDSFVRRRLR